MKERSKRIMALLLTGAMVVFAGCGSSGNTSASDKSQDEDSASDSSETGEVADASDIGEPN